uniref:Uncharacterized protein n=1 Tax=Octopus bimaculoides TaxID=37653 RepID=A0A0L8HX43_OCTBM
MVTKSIFSTFFNTRYCPGSSKFSTFSRSSISPIRSSNSIFDILFHVMFFSILLLFWIEALLLFRLAALFTEVRPLVAFRDAPDGSDPPLRERTPLTRLLLPGSPSLLKLSTSPVPSLLLLHPPPSPPAAPPPPPPLLLLLYPT